MPELDAQISALVLRLSNWSTFRTFKDVVAIHPTIQIVGFLAPLPVRKVPFVRSTLTLIVSREYKRT
jgi:hypothetical protein